MSDFKPSNGGPLAGHGSAEPEYVPHDDLDKPTRRKPPSNWELAGAFSVLALFGLGTFACLWGAVWAILDHFSK